MRHFWNKLRKLVKRAKVKWSKTHRLPLNWQFRQLVILFEPNSIDITLSCKWNQSMPSVYAKQPQWEVVIAVQGLKIAHLLWRIIRRQRKCHAIVALLRIHRWWHQYTLYSRSHLQLSRAKQNRSAILIVLAIQMQANHKRVSGDCWTEMLAQRLWVVVVWRMLDAFSSVELLQLEPRFVLLKK